MKKIGLFLCLFSASIVCAESLTIAAGAGYKKPVQEIVAVYEAKQNKKVEAIYGNMAQIFAQAKQTEISILIADKKFLEKQKELEVVDYLSLGEGKAVLAYAKGVRLEKWEDIAKDSIKRVAMPDAKKAIYGQAGAEFLENAHIMQSIKDKLLVVATVPQVTSYVSKHEVDVGIINLSVALDNYTKIGGYIKIPEQYYTKIEIVAARLGSCQKNVSCQSFLEFLKTPEAQKIFEKYGL